MSNLAKKTTLLFKALKKHTGLFLIGFSFISIGIILVFIGLRSEIISLLIFGGVFICVALFFIYTLPSSVKYYYDKELSKKFGKNTMAQIIEKEIMNHSYLDDKGNKEVLVEEFNYLLKYSFDYQNQTFENVDFVTEKQYKKLEIGNLIPVQFLTSHPKKSSIRKIKLKQFIREN